MACKFIPLKGFPEAIIEIETTPDIALPQDTQEQEIIEPPSSETVTDVQNYAESADAAEDSTEPESDEAPLTIDEGSRYVL